MTDMWNSANKENYKRAIEKDGEAMRKPTITTKHIEQALKSTKTRKAAGPDGLKPEMYKALLTSEACTKKLAECMTEELHKTTEMAEWKISKTKMLRKIRKPTAKDLRPIALTNTSYKIFMTQIKRMIEEHIMKNGKIKEGQAAPKQTTVCHID
ncbi:hypothetical protein SNEBB_003012 [Seison nebaliae]|nr:hypothetical protein SNEBB_003012 [Seison nebaliae]